MAPKRHRASAYPQIQVQGVGAAVGEYAILPPRQS